MNKIAIYIGNFDFPNNNAGGNRVLNNGKVLRELGYEVYFIGLKKNIPISKKNIEDTKEEYEGFTGYSLNYPTSKKDWISYKKIFKKIINFLDKKFNKIDLIISYHSPRISLFNKKLLKWSKKNNIKIVCDIDDWLPANNGNFIYRIIKFLDNYYRNSILNLKYDGLIVVSSYLENYYKNKNKNINIIRIPPLFDTEIASDSFEIKKGMNLIYSGKPFPTDGRKVKKDSYKDRLDIVIELLSEIDKNIKYVFNIYGITKEEYLRVIPKHEMLIKKLGEKIIFNGFKNHKEVINEIKNSDFTVFLRDINRGSMAGFPTKFAESFSLGTPIITNNTSDLSDYLEEGKTGYFLDIYNLKESKKKLEKILLTPKKEILKMKENCIKKDYFNYKNKISEMQTFLDNL